MSPPVRKSQGKPGYQLLLGRLEAYRRIRNIKYPAWNARCPMGDHRLLIEYRVSKYRFIKEPVLLVWCRTCRVSLNEICNLLGLEVHRVLDGNACLNREIGRRQTPPGILPTPAEIGSWRKRLWNDPELLAYLRDKRGLNFHTIIRYRIGHDGDRYTLPVYSGDEIINLRRYLPAVKKRKMIGLAGRTSNNLYPDVPDGPCVLLCEGEWDTLVARQYGLPAVTSTGGVDGWDTAWNNRFRGRLVAIAYDCQDISTAAAHRRAEELVGVAQAVKVVELGLGHKEDVTDWFTKYERTAADLRELIKGTNAIPKPSTGLEVRATGPRPRLKGPPGIEKPRPVS